MSARTDNHTASLEGIRENFVCGYCDKAFKYKGWLEMHVRKHTGERPFQCQRCHKFFTQLSNFKIHVSKHTVKPRYKCQYCYQLFNKLSYFQDHIITHTGKSSYQCEYCLKSFFRAHDLKAHVRTHTRELQLQCQYCSQSFIQLSDLNKHICAHTRERSNESPLCSESFAPSNNHTTHILKQHPFDRPHCQPSFPKESDVAEHVNTCTPGSWCSDAINVNYLPHPQSTPKPLDSSHINNHTRDNRLSGVNNVLTNNSDRYFTESGSLEEGIQTQTYAYPNNYPRCLDTSNNRSRHVDRHQTFSCPHCQQSFLDQSYVTEHIRTCTRRSDDYAPNRNHHRHLSKPGLLDTSHVNRNVDDNGLKRVNVPTSNVAVDERNDFNGNVDQTARPVGIEAKDLNFADPENSLDIRLTVQTNTNLTSNPPTIGLPQPPEQSLSSTQPDYLVLHREQYEQWESSFSAYSSIPDTQDSFDLLYDFPTNQDNQTSEDEFFELI